MGIGLFPSIFILKLASEVNGQSCSDVHWICESLVGLSNVGSVDCLLNVLMVQSISLLLLLLSHTNQFFVTVKGGNTQSSISAINLSIFECE